MRRRQYGELSAFMVHYLRETKITQDFLWLVCDDFNEIMYSTKKDGGISKDEWRSLEMFLKNAYCWMLDI